MVRGVFLCSLQKHRTVADDLAVMVMGLVLFIVQDARGHPARQRRLLNTRTAWTEFDTYEILILHYPGKAQRQRLTAFPLPKFPFKLETLRMAVFLDEKGFICYKCLLAARPFRSQVTIPNSLKDKK